MLSHYKALDTRNTNKKAHRKTNVTSIYTWNRKDGYVKESNHFLLCLYESAQGRGSPFSDSSGTKRLIIPNTS